MFTNSYGDGFETQRALEEKSLEHTLAKFCSTANANELSNYKSNNTIFCQLFWSKVIDAEMVLKLRKDERKITYSKEQADQSIVLITEVVDNASSVELIRDESVHIVF